MWPFLGELLKYAREKKLTLLLALFAACLALAANAVIAWQGKKYIDDRHDAAVSQIEKHSEKLEDNTKKVQQLSDNNVVLTTHIEAMQTLVQDMKKTVDKADDRLWRLYQKQIKENGHGS